MKKHIIKIKESQLNNIIKEGFSNVLENLSVSSFKVEDFFDIQSLSKKDLLSLATDLLSFIGGEGYGSKFNDNGELFIKEESNRTMPIKELRKELQKIGFKQWQIKTTIYANKVRVVILLADLAKNIQVVENKMLDCGWTKARISEPTIVQGIKLRIMDFDPQYQKSLTDNVRQNNYLYHWTPFENVESIFKNGLQLRSDNDFLSYPPKVHLLKSDINKKNATILAWKLFNKNKKLRSGRYALLRIEVNKLPNNIDFFGDPRFEYGYFTKDSIPSKCITLFGEITFTDKNNFNNEKIQILVPNDTMLD